MNTFTFAVFWLIIVVQLVSTIRNLVVANKTNTARKALEKQLDKLTKMEICYKEMTKDLDQWVKNIKGGNLEAAEHYADEIHRLHGEFMQIE